MLLSFMHESENDCLLFDRKLSKVIAFSFFLNWQQILIHYSFINLIFRPIFHSSELISQTWPRRSLRRNLKKKTRKNWFKMRFITKNAFQFSSIYSKQSIKYAIKLRGPLPAFVVPPHFRFHWEFSWHETRMI